MKKPNKVWQVILNIWKDSVWSKVISVGIIILIGSIWTRYSNYSSEQVYNFLILILIYKLPIYVFLSSIGFYFLIRLILNLFKKKPDPIWDEKVGNYKFKELYKILSSQNYPVETAGMQWSRQKPPKDDLLTMFHTYSILFSKGINLDSNLKDGGYIYGVLAPKLVSYGLVDKIESKNLRIDIVDTKYQTSEVGHKFFALLEKSIHLKPKDKARTANIS